MILESLHHHHVNTVPVDGVTVGKVRYDPIKSLWLIGNLLLAVIGGLLTFTLGALIPARRSLLRASYNLRICVHMCHP